MMQGSKLMEPRSVLKALRDFAARELKEKRANRVDVRRVKMKSLMRKGRLPDLRVWSIEGGHYLVCVFRGADLRVYYMDKLGKMLGADDFTGEKKRRAWREISKRTKRVLRLPT